MIQSADVVPKGHAAPKVPASSLVHFYGTYEPRTEDQIEDERPKKRSIFVKGLRIIGETRWTVPAFSSVAALLAFLRGFTIAYSSSATLDLMGEAKELPKFPAVAQEKTE